MAQHVRDSISKKSLLVLLKLVSLPGIVHRSLALFIGVLLLSESVTATPQMGVSIAQQPAATEQDATRAAAKRAFQEGVQLYKQGTAESLRQAIAKWEEALPLWQTTGDKVKEALTLNNIGGAYSDLGEKQKALEFYNQSLPLSRATGNKATEAATLSNIGEVYFDLGEKQKALSFFNQSLPLRRVTGNKAGEAVTLINIGVVYSALGEKQKALDYYNQSLPLSRATGNKATEATTLNNIGKVYSDLGEKQKALDYYNQSLPLSQATGDKVGEATIINNIGKVYDDLGEKQKALDYYNQSLPLSQATGDKAGEAITLNNIGQVYDDLGEEQKALDYYNQCLPLRRATGNKAGEAITLNNIGQVYSDLGEKQKALDYYDQSLPLSRATGDKAGEATTLNNIGKVYDDLGEKQKALDYYDQSLPLSRATGDKAGEATTLNNIGKVYGNLGEKQKALAFFSQSLPLSQATGDKAQAATTLSNIGGVYSTLGEKQQAIEFYNQSLPLSRATGDKAQEATTLNNIGQVYNYLGEKQKALSFFNQSLPLSRATGDKAGEAATLGNVAYLERSRGNLNVALTQIEAAINIIENLRTKIASQQLRAAYFASQQGYYEFYIDLLMQLHKTNPSKGYDALALNVSERTKARNLLEILKEARADIRRGVDPKLREQERTLQQQLDVLDYRKFQLLNGQRGSQETQESNAIPKQIESLLGQLNDVQAKIRVKSPVYADLTQPGKFTLKLPEIQDKVLDDNTLLLEYSLGEDRSYLWAVTKTGITSYELPKRADIEAAAKKFSEQFQSEAASNPEAGMKLSQMLLAPVAGQLGQKRLLIVGDGILQTIPFAALPILNHTQASVPTPRPEINLRANSQSRLKTTETSTNSPLPFGNAQREQRTLAITQGLKPLADANAYTPLLVQHEIVNLPSASTIAVLREQLKGRKPAPKAVAVLADPVFSLDDERFNNTPNPSSVCTPIAASQHPTSLATNIPADLKRSIFQMGSSIGRLPYSRCEAQQILNLVPTNEREQALDFTASRAAATSPDLAQYRMVHFATHGLLNYEHPELSGVVLSLVDEKGSEQDGFLRLNDIYNLNLPAELVVLSACETGLAGLVKDEKGELKDTPGEGLVGLTRGFMYAGSKRVVVSLWRVQDQATAELMQKFYTQMLQKKLNPVAALRAAQLEMWKTQAWQNPYYWAAFEIQGEWR